MAVCVDEVLSTDLELWGVKLFTFSLSPSLPAPLPPFLQPFTVSHLGLCAGIMVTASHNPKQDNGYKVTTTSLSHLYTFLGETKLHNC